MFVSVAIHLRFDVRIGCHSQGNWCPHYLYEDDKGKVTGSYTATIDNALFIGGMLYATRCLETEAGSDVKAQAERYMLQTPWWQAVPPDCGPAIKMVRVGLLGLP